MGAIDAFLPGLPRGDLRPDRGRRRALPEPPSRRRDGRARQPRPRPRLRHRAGRRPAPPPAHRRGGDGDGCLRRGLLGPQSQVLDAGLARRVPSAPTRAALRVRDRGCVWPGCERPASWTTAHHVLHWGNGGVTEVPNLVLLCHRHHWSVHEGGWQVVRTEGREVLAIPRRFRTSPGLARPMGCPRAE